MRRTGLSRIAAILLLTLLIGVAGPSLAGRVACAAVQGCARPGCHNVPKVVPPCCGGNAETSTSCCGRSEVPLGTALQAPSPLEVMAASLFSSAAAPAAFAQPADAAPVRLIKILPPRESVGLYTLYSALLI
jgi:hypothetical protein